MIPRCGPKNLYGEQNSTSTSSDRKSSARCWARCTASATTMAPAERPRRTISVAAVIVPVAFDARVNATIFVRGPTAGEGYWNQRAKSRRTFNGEWTFTGDKYRRDADGYYYYCGRTDDMFKVSGMWVSPFEVEAALASHEAVLEAAVIGKQDQDGLIKPKAFIVLRNGFAADDQLLETLRVLVKQSAGPWKYPRWIDIRPDLPRTATGKIQRFKLRELES